MYTSTTAPPPAKQLLANVRQDLWRRVRVFYAKRVLPCETPWHLRKNVCVDVPKPSKKETPEDKSVFANPRNFGEKLKNKGFEQLGHGAYSEVYGKPGSDKVIKILRRPDEDAWVDYMRWSAAKGYAGTFAPKVTSYKYFTAPWRATKKQNFAVAVMERLEPLKDQDQKFMCRTVEHVACHNGGFAGKLVDTFAPGMLQFIEDLNKEFPKSLLDMHGGNFMLRKNGEFVSTDPVARKLKRETIRLKAGDLKPLPTIH
jgi:hypothetical protein